MKCTCNFCCQKGKFISNNLVAKLLTSVWGRPVNDSSCPKLVLFTVNETLLSWMSTQTHSSETFAALVSWPNSVSTTPRNSLTYLVFWGGKEITYATSDHLSFNSFYYSLNLELSFATCAPIIFCYLMKTFCLKNLRDFYTFEQVVTSVY